MLMRIASLFVGLVAGVAAASCASLPFLKWQGDGQVVQTANGACLDLEPRVRACQSGDKLEVTVSGRTHAYKKSELKSLLRERIFQFVRTTPYPVATLKNAVVELWLDAPVFTPESAHFVAVVLSKGGNFRARLPLDAAAWQIDGESLALLGTDAFPSATARRAGKLAVAAKPHITGAALRDFLGRSGAPLVDATGEAVVVLETGAFAETEVAKKLASQRDARLYVQEIELIPATEPDGSRALLTSFSDARNGKQ